MQTLGYRMMKVGAAMVTVGLMALALLVLVAPVQAQGGTVPPAPGAPLPADFLTLTVGGLIAWLISFGISAAVAYVLGQFPQLNDQWRTWLSTIANAVLAALVTAVASLLPQTAIDMKLTSVLVAGMTFVVNWAGTYLGQFKAADQRLALALKVKQAMVAGVSLGVVGSYARKL